MEQINRWKIYIHTGQIVEELDKEGDWVFYEDHLDIIKGFIDKIEDLQCDLEYARNN